MRMDFGSHRAVFRPALIDPHWCPAEPSGCVVCFSGAAISVQCQTITDITPSIPVKEHMPGALEPDNSTVRHKTCSRFAMIQGNQRIVGSVDDHEWTSDVLQLLCQGFWKGAHRMNVIGRNLGIARVADIERSCVTNGEFFIERSFAVQKAPFVTHDRSMSATRAMPNYYRYHSKYPGQRTYARRPGAGQQYCSPQDVQSLRHDPGEPTDRRFRG